LEGKQPVFDIGWSVVADSSVWNRYSGARSNAPCVDVEVAVSSSGEGIRVSELGVTMLSVNALNAPEQIARELVTSHCQFTKLPWEYRTEAES
jgi:hypothetical protein